MWCLWGRLARKQKLWQISKAEVIKGIQGAMRFADGKGRGGDFQDF
jgi:hypothetical protein